MTTNLERIAAARVSDLVRLGWTAALDLGLPPSLRRVGAVVTWLPLTVNLLPYAHDGDLLTTRDRDWFAIATDQSQSWVRGSRFIAAGVTVGVLIAVLGGLVAWAFFALVPALVVGGLFVAWSCVASVLIQRRHGLVDVADMEVVSKRPHEPYWVVMKSTSRVADEQELQHLRAAIDEFAPVEMLVLCLPYDLQQLERFTAAGLARDPHFSSLVTWTRSVGAPIPGLPNAHGIA